MQKKIIVVQCGLNAEYSITTDCQVKTCMWNANVPNHCNCLLAKQQASTLLKSEIAKQKGLSYKDYDKLAKQKRLEIRDAMIILKYLEHRGYVKQQLAPLGSKFPFNIPMLNLNSNLDRLTVREWNRYIKTIDVKINLARVLRLTSKQLSLLKKEIKQ